MGLTKNNLLEYALKYASLGWHVFPLAPGKKTPITKHGVKDATTDEAQIRAWWEKWPDANIGVACGAKSGVYVIDVDIDQEKGINGYDSLTEFSDMPKTVAQGTPRGGFHAFYRTDNPPANKNSFRPGIDIRGDGYYVVLAPSVHPNGGRYRWADGHAPWEIKLAEYPESLRPVKQSPQAKRATVAGVPANKPAAIADEGVLRRASLWLARCDPAIQGQDGHGQLFAAAQAMVNGFLLPDSRAYALLASEYNPRCVPPWDFSNQKDEKDFRRKITEARKHPCDKPRGWLLNDPDYAPVDTSGVEIDVAKLIEKARGNVLPLPATDCLPVVNEQDAAAQEKELEFLTQPTGLLGEICSWINANSNRPQPFLTLGCSLAFLGALYGRKIKDANDGRTNLYCMGVAQSSAGKNNAPKRIRQLCMSIGCIDLLGGDNFASDSAIELRISRRPATLFLVDEIGHLMAHIKSGSSHHAQIVSLLMRLYSTAGDIYLGKEYAEEGKQRTIIEPCCCVYGMATPERFTGGVSPDEIQDGWLSRCLMFHSDRYSPKLRGVRLTPPPESIVTQCREWWQRGKGDPEGHIVPKLMVGQPGQFTEAPPEQVMVKTTPDAERAFIALDDELTGLGRKDDQMTVMYAKGEENARRIALICAASENASEPEITASIADYACRLIRFLLDSFLRVIVPEIVDSQIGKNKRRIVAVVKRSGKAGCLHRRITKRTEWANRRTRDELISDLLEAGEIVRELDGNTWRYWTAENYIAFKKAQ